MKCLARLLAVRDPPPSECKAEQTREFSRSTLPGIILSKRGGDRRSDDFNSQKCELIKTWGDYCGDIDIHRNTANNWLKRWFITEMAQEIWIARTILSSHYHRDETKVSTWSQYCVDVGSQKQIVKRWYEPWLLNSISSASNCLLAGTWTLFSPYPIG